MSPLNLRPVGSVPMFACVQVTVSGLLWGSLSCQHAQRQPHVPPTPFLPRCVTCHPSPAHPRGSLSGARAHRGRATLYPTLWTGGLGVSTARPAALALRPAHDRCVTDACRLTSPKKRPPPGHMHPPPEDPPAGCGRGPLCPFPSSSEGGAGSHVFNVSRSTGFTDTYASASAVPMAPITLAERWRHPG